MPRSPANWVTPNTVMLGARLVLPLGAAFTAYRILALRPAMGPEAAFLSAYALSALALTAFPRLRRSDIAAAACIIFAAAELTSLGVHTGFAFGRWAGEAAGVGAAIMPLLLHRQRRQAGENGHMTLADWKAQDRRRQGRARRAPLRKPVVSVLTEAPPSDGVIDG